MAQVRGSCPLSGRKPSSGSTSLQEMTMEASDSAQDLQRFVDHSMVKMPKGILWMGSMPESELTTDTMPDIV